MLHLDFTLFWEMDGASLVCWSPEVSLVVDFIGFSLSIFWILLLPG